MCDHPLVIVYFDSFKRNKQFASITPDFHQELSCSLLQLRLTRFPAVGYELRLSWVLITGCKLRLRSVPAAGYKLPLNPSYGWLIFWQLDTSYSGHLWNSIKTNANGFPYVSINLQTRLIRSLWKQFVQLITNIQPDMNP